MTKNTWQPRPAFLATHACRVAIGLGVGCGRLSFDAPDAGVPGSPDAAIDAPDEPPAPIARVTTFVMQSVRAANPTLTTDAFTTHAMLAGDAILVHVLCEANVAPSSVTLSAPRWNFVRLDPIAGSAQRSAWGTSFGAIAPDTAAVTVSVAWTFGGGGCTFVDEIGDEFTNNDPAGGEITFESHVAQIGAGTACTASVLTKHDGDAVWAACTPAERVTEPITGYTVGARDGLGDLSAFKLTSDPAGTVESIAMPTTTNDSFLITMVAIKPR